MCKIFANFSIGSRYTFRALPKEILESESVKLGIGLTTTLLIVILCTIITGKAQSTCSWWVNSRQTVARPLSWRSLPVLCRTPLTADPSSLLSSSPAHSEYRVNPIRNIPCIFVILFSILLFFQDSIFTQLKRCFWVACWNIWEQLYWNRPYVIHFYQFYHPNFHLWDA